MAGMLTCLSSCESCDPEALPSSGGGKAVAPRGSGTDCGPPADPPAVVAARADALLAGGVALGDAGRYHEAVALLATLLTSPGVDYVDESLATDDSLPELVRFGFGNFRHRAALVMSKCHERLGALDRALEYAFLARDEFPRRSFCGTCADGARAALDDRIRELQGYLTSGARWGTAAAPSRK